MKLVSTALVALLALVAMGSSLANEVEKDIVTTNENEAARELLTRAQRIQLRKERREARKAKRLARRQRQQQKKNQYKDPYEDPYKKDTYYDDPYKKDTYYDDPYKKEPYHNDPYMKDPYMKDPYQDLGGDTCVLSACVSMYPKEYKYGYYGHRNMKKAKSWKKKGDSWSWSTTTPAPGDDYDYDVSGKVTMTFDLYESHRTQKPSSFYWEFYLRGLKPGDSGIVHLFEENTCSAYDGNSNDPFYNFFVQTSRSPWFESIGYTADSSGKDHGKFLVNNAWTCEMSVGRTVYVEIPGSDKFGCGVMMQGDAPCGYSGGYGYGYGHH